MKKSHTFIQNAIIIGGIGLSKLFGGDVQGQTSSRRDAYFLQKNVPNFNFIPSATLKLSTDCWRLRPYISLEKRAQVRGKEFSHLDQRYVYCWWDRMYYLSSYILTSYQSGVASLMPLYFGLGTEINLFGTTSLNLGAHYEMGSGVRPNLSAGINHKWQTSRRTTLKTYLNAKQGRSHIAVNRGGTIFFSPWNVRENNLTNNIADAWGPERQNYSNRFTKFKGGVKFKLDFERMQGMSLSAGVNFGRKINVIGENHMPVGTGGRGGFTIESFPEAHNLLGLTVGLQYNIPTRWTPSKQDLRQQQGHRELRRDPSQFQRWDGYPARHQRNR